MEDTLKKFNQTHLTWVDREERDREKVTSYENLQEVELLRKELAEVKRSKEEVEFRYSEMRDRYV